jgi:hypothetical protein
MALVPNDWSVVVIGHWNRAILSPAGIAKRLFKLPEGTPVQVLVPLDVVAPYHVRHENVTVVPGSDRLVVQPARSTFANLVEAIAITRRALEDLPRTPVSAAGLNLRYKSDEAIQVLQDLTASPWDDRIDAKGQVIHSRSIIRAIDWRDGKITTSVTQENSGACSVLLNFDFRSAESEKLVEWLNVSDADLEAQARLILHDTIGLSPEDFADG